MRAMTALCFLLSSTAVAQPPVYVVNPDSAPPGVSRTLTVTGSAPVTLSWSNCYYSTFHDNDAGRTMTFAFGFASICSPGGPSLAPGQSVSTTFNVPGSVPPGTYWLKCLYNQGGQTFIEKWVDFHVAGPNDPLLSAPAPTWGAPWALTLSYPADPSAAYVAVASLGQNNRIAGGGLILSVEQDFLFDLSFPSPNPLLFTGFGLGGLNAAGTATLSMNLPPVVGFILGVHVQAALIPVITPGPVILSNCVDAAIQ